MLISIDAFAVSHSLYFGNSDFLLSNKPEAWFGRIIVILVLISAVTSLVFLKSAITDRIIGRSAMYDPIWNVEELKSHARNLFFNLSKALNNRDISSLTSALTPELYQKQQTIISELVENKQINILKNIDIQVLEIVGCEDRKDNSKDKYIAYFEGRILDYTILESTREIIKNSRRILSDFSCTYHFVRIENEWKLEKINDSVSRLDILKTKTLIED